jgi:hypothetical protein
MSVQLEKCYALVGGWREGWIDGWMDGQTYRQIDRRMDGSMDRDRYIDLQTDS